VSGRPASPHTLTSAEEPVVFVVDDDASMREALSNLFRSVGLRVEVFGSAHEFLQSTLPNVASCLILDIRLPRQSGLDFQAELAKADIRIPIIFMTGHGDIPMTVRAMKAGAVDFLTKPSATRTCWMPSPRQSNATGLAAMKPGSCRACMRVSRP
jgi:FixJ family two-component response regulator